MTESAISTLKNHLPEMVHLAESGQDVHITRHGKPVAVMVSLERYTQAFTAGKGIFSSGLRWRDKHPGAEGFSDEDIKQMHRNTRQPFPESDSVWE
jgi:prevent-host-death family protein